MMYKIRNMTYSPLRIILEGRDIRLLPRDNTYLKEINEDIRLLEKKKLIKIRVVK